MTIYDVIKHLADEKKVKISTIEEKVGIGNGSISKWKKNVPKVDNLCKVAAFLECNIVYILQHSGFVDYTSPMPISESKGIYKSDLSENQVELLQILERFDDERAKIKFIARIENLAEEMLSDE